MIPLKHNLVILRTFVVRHLITTI